MHSGAAKLLLGPRCWLVAVIVAAVVATVVGVLVAGIALNWLWLVLVMGLVIVAVAIGHASAERLRGHVLGRFVNALEDPLRIGQAPHVIAHSLGTYIVGRALLDYSAVRFGRVILLAAVLRRSYDWHGLSESDSKKYCAVRNEVGAKDWVARAAALLYGLIPPMGHAGLSGFVECEGVTHNQRSPWLECKNCKASVHNVRHPLGHNELARTARIQAVSFWLPYFWGIEPEEYKTFVQLCLEASGSWDAASVLKSRNALFKSAWSWCGGSLRGFVKKQIQCRRKLERERTLSFGDLDSRAKHAILLAAALVKHATESAENVGTKVLHNDIRFLLPANAVIAAVDSVWSGSE